MEQIVPWEFIPRKGDATVPPEWRGQRQWLRGGVYGQKINHGVRDIGLRAPGCGLQSKQKNGRCSQGSGEKNQACIPSTRGHYNAKV